MKQFSLNIKKGYKIGLKSDKKRNIINPSSQFKAVKGEHKGNEKLKRC